MENFNEPSYPLSAFQKLTGLARRKHGHAANLVNACFKLQGELDVARLARAIELLPAVVPELSCALRSEAGELSLQRGMFGTLASRIIDLRETPSAREEAAAIVEVAADTAFQVLEEALARSSLLRIAADETWWMISCHTLVADQRSAEGLLHVVAAIYRSLRDDALFPRCSDDWAEQIAYVFSPQYSADFAYWESQSAQEKSPLNLCKPLRETKRQAHVQDFALPAAWHAGLGVLASALDSDIETVFSSAVLLFLHKYSGSPSVSVGLSQTRSSLRINEQTVGLRAENVPLFLDIDAEATVAGLVANVAERLAGHRAHRQFAQDQLIEVNDSRKEHEQKRYDLVCRHEVTGGADLGARAIGRHAFNSRCEHTPELGLVFDACDASLRLTLAFDAVDLDPAHGNNLLDGVACLLGEMLTQGIDARVQDLAMVSAAQTARLLGPWAGGENEAVPVCCTHTMFEAQAAAHPDAPALVFEGKVLSYAELNRKSNRMAAALIHAGVQPGSLVGIFVERSPELVMTVLGILKAGCAFVPLDIDYPYSRLEYIIDDAALALVVSQTSVKAKLPPSGQRKVLCVDEIDWHSPAPDRNIEPAELGIDASALAYVIYTSGTTGNPKGVLIEHAGVVNLAYGVSEELLITAQSRVLQFASMSFDAAICEFVITFARGATLYLASQQERLVPDLLSDLVQAGQVTHAILPPVLLKYLSFEKFRSVGNLVVVGESTPTEVAKLWGRGRRLVNGYGPTENTVCVTQSLFDGVSLNIGRPIRNVRCYVLDAQERLVPVGAAGELYVGGAGVARGYLNQPALTDSKFVPDRFTGHGKLYKTGDLVRWLPDGNLDFVGRRDQQVKIRGLRVELEEVEAHIEQVRGVSQGTVLVKDVAVELGDGSEAPAGPRETEKCLVAFIVLSNPQLTIAAIRKALRGAVPQYMIPTHFLVVDQFPLTHNRKIDKKKLLAMPLDRCRA